MRVHPEFLAGQKLPKQCVTKEIWEERFEDIRQVRALPDAQWHDRTEVFPPRFQG